VSEAPRILLGTSSFTAPGWERAFYPPRMHPRDYLSYYVCHYSTLEIDATFYRCPSPATVNGWHAKTPPGFVFAVKVPQSITHDKVLVGCEAELDEFLGVLSLLGEKLGPIVFQFPYFNQTAFASPGEFVARLRALLRTLPRDRKFALELRNKYWLTPQFADLLREYNVALVLQDQSWMPGYAELEKKFDPITADWTYVRWLGDRKGIETITKTFEREVVDRTAEMQTWVDVCYRVQNRGTTIFAYANNHYSGFAPATLAQFLGLWKQRELPPIAMPDAPPLREYLPGTDPATADPVTGSPSATLRRTKSSAGSRSKPPSTNRTLFD
jgi:uncharacterized protein YecE (DUF72 family)